MTSLATETTRDSAVPTAAAEAPHPSATFDVAPGAKGLVITLDSQPKPEKVTMEGEDIHIQWEDAASPATLTFRMTRGLELDRVDLGWLKQTLDSGAMMDLPFWSSYDPEARQLVLKVVNDQAYRPYSLTFHAVDGEQHLRHDPRIYSDGPPPADDASC
jgi:hypothetical protein